MGGVDAATVAATDRGYRWARMIVAPEEAYTSTAMDVVVHGEG